MMDWDLGIGRPDDRAQLGTTHGQMGTGTQMTALSPLTWGTRSNDSQPKSSTPGGRTEGLCVLGSGMQNNTLDHRIQLQSLAFTPMMLNTLIGVFEDIVVPIILTVCWRRRQPYENLFSVTVDAAAEQAGRATAVMAGPGPGARFRQAGRGSSSSKRYCWNLHFSMSTYSSLQYFSQRISSSPRSRSLMPSMG